MNYIPVVDLNGIPSSNLSTDNFKEIAEKIDNALSSIGFVYLINHGIDQNLIKNAFEESKLFFELPIDIKRKYKMDYSITGQNGYSEPGQELLNEDSKFELRETYDISNSTLKIVHNPNPDEEVPNFYPSLNNLRIESKILAKKLLRILALTMKIEDEDYFIKCTKNLDAPDVSSYTCFRTLYYPSITAEYAQNLDFVRCAEHSDYGTLTLLFQDEIGGLEVKNVDGNWVPAMPIKNSVLINTGDLLDFWSNGKFPATKHRVLIPEEELLKKTPRQSIVYFIHPDDDTMVTPFINKDNETDKDNLPAISAYEHAKIKLENSYKIPKNSADK